MAPRRSKRARRQSCNWSELQPEILDLFLQRLHHQDCLTFGKVCKTWRSVFVDRRRISRPPPCLMLLRSTPAGKTMHRGIFNEGQLLRLLSPKPKLHPSYRIVGSSMGWLVLACLFGCEIYLLNPASNKRILLPYMATGQVPMYQYPYAPACVFIQHVDLSSCPTIGDCVLVARVLCRPGQIHCLARCSPGDQEWTIITIQPQDLLEGSLDSVFHKGKLHVLLNNGDTVICTFDPQPKITIKVSMNNFCSIDQLELKRLVRSNGEVLLVVRKVLESQLLVFRITEEQGGGWVKVENMGDHVLLIGKHGAESLCTKDLMGSNYEPSCIYYITPNQFVEKYCITDGTSQNIPVREQYLEWVVTKAW